MFWNIGIKVEKEDILKLVKLLFEGA